MENNNPNMSEAELLRRLKGGEEIAFDRIFNSFQRSLVFFANRLFAADDLKGAEELVQDVFLKFYPRRMTFDSLAHIKSFLYVSTKNACLDKIAAEKVRARRFQKFMVGFDDEEESVLAQITYAELLREVYTGIESLPERCKQVMKLFFVECKTAQEIAEQLNITVSTVNNQKARAIVLLRNRLSEEGLGLLLAVTLFLT